MNKSLLILSSKLIFFKCYISSNNFKYISKQNVVNHRLLKYSVLDVVEHQKPGFVNKYNIT